MIIIQEERQTERKDKWFNWITIVKTKFIYKAYDQKQYFSFIVVECLISITCHPIFDVNIVQRLSPIGSHMNSMLKIVPKRLLYVHLRNLVAVFRYNSS